MYTEQLFSASGEADNTGARHYTERRPKDNPTETASNIYLYRYIYVYIYTQ